MFAISLTSTSAPGTVSAAISSFSNAPPFAVPSGDGASAAVVGSVPVMAVVLLVGRPIVAGLTPALSRDHQEEL